MSLVKSVLYFLFREEIRNQTKFTQADCVATVLSLSLSRKANLLTVYGHKWISDSHKTIVLMTKQAFNLFKTTSSLYFGKEEHLNCGSLKLRGSQFSLSLIAIEMRKFEFLTKQFSPFLINFSKQNYPLIFL